MLRVLVVGALLLAAGSASAGAIVGGLAAAGHGERCVAFPAGTVAVGDKVTLVGSESESSWWSAVVTVQREVADCAKLEVETMAVDGATGNGGTGGGPYYELSVPAGADPYNWVAIAVPGTPRLRRTANGFTAELDGRPPREHLHICATYEGLQLTIWSGPPYKGQRRAHAYYYLGYDVDPTCPDILAADERERLKKD
jgi:hypothetical protein